MLIIMGDHELCLPPFSNHLPHMMLTALASNSLLLLQLFESREEHHSLEVNSISQHNTCHDEYSKRDGSILTNLLAMTLQQQINAKEVQQKVENNTKSNLHDQVSISIKQISELHGLRLSDTLSMREYKYLKEMLVNKLIQMLKTDEDDYDKESSSRQ